MTGHLVVVQAGPGVTIQDRGRRGLMRYGVTPAGPMDAAAHALANGLLGNAADAAVVEVSLGGLTLRAEAAPVPLAFAGGAFDIRVDGRIVGPTGRLLLPPGALLSIRAGARGAYACLAVADGIAVAPVLGSRSTHIRSRLGPFGGRGLVAGDVLPVGSSRLAGDDRTGLPALDHGDRPIRIMPGPQADLFADGELDRLDILDFAIGARSDRMALQLEGPRLRHRAGHDIVSDGIVMGAIQVPGDGRPFVLMADRQPTGGYPKIACVISADLPALAQKRPGETLRFTRVDAAAAARALAERRDALRAALAQAAATGLDPEALLFANLIGGVVDALDD